MRRRLSLTRRFTCAVRVADRGPRWSLDRLYPPRRSSSCAPRRCFSHSRQRSSRAGARSQRPATGTRSSCSFLGQLTATPSNGGVSITVQGGNKAALRAMLGAAGHADVRVRHEHRVPEVVARHPDRRAGRRPRRRRLRLGARPRAARRDARRRSSSRPPASSATTARSSTSPTSRCTSSAARSRRSARARRHGPRHRRRPPRAAAADRQSSDQTFTFGDETIFLLWQGKVPTVIDASKLVVGDRIVVRIRADKGSSLGAGRGDAGEPHRRPRAGRQVSPQSLGPAPAFAGPGRCCLVLQRPYAYRPRRGRRYDHEPSPLHVPRHRARRGEQLLLARAGRLRAPDARSSTSSSAGT